MSAQPMSSPSMNKMDLLDDVGRARLRATLRRFNPAARLLGATYGKVAPASILGTGLFSLARAAQHPGWLAEARVGEQTVPPEWKSCIMIDPLALAHASMFGVCAVPAGVGAASQRSSAKKKQTR